ncbi:MAG: DnaD domain protein [Oscillospiraceae bacterium]|nr:DnaD domain protein [Oscillospiraceae bacterium]
MDEGKRKICRPAVFVLPLGDVEALLAASDGDGALLYLHILKCGGTYDEARACRDLRLSQRAVQAAATRLERMGLLSAATPEPATAGELPEYRARDVVRRSEESPEFKALVEEAQAALGRVLSSADLKRLFGIYDNLALPAEVIMLLIHHCKEENEEKYGPGRPLGFAYIEKEAYRWINLELVTYDQAEAWLAERERRRSLTGQIQRAMGIQGRRLSATERKYIDDWITLGFGPEALALAADRTVTNTGELKWKYMNSIVHSWHQKGLHTVEEIEKGDHKPAARTKTDAAAPASKPDAQELERMRRLREKIKNS